MTFIAPSNDIATGYKYFKSFTPSKDHLLILTGVEISDEEAEKVFTCSDAVELLKTKLDIH